MNKSYGIALVVLTLCSWKLWAECTETDIAYIKEQCQTICENESKTALKTGRIGKIQKYVYTGDVSGIECRAGNIPLSGKCPCQLR